MSLYLVTRTYRSRYCWCNTYSVLFNNETLTLYCLTMRISIILLQNYNWKKDIQSHKLLQRLKCIFNVKHRLCCGEHLDCGKVKTIWILKYRLQIKTSSFSSKQKNRSIIQHKTSQNISTSEIRRNMKHSSKRQITPKVNKHWLTETIVTTTRTHSYS